MACYGLFEVDLEADCCGFFLVPLYDLFESVIA